jgi:hypothetical protein
MSTSFYVKYPLFLPDFNDSNFLARFSKNTQISNFMKIHPVGDELFRTDGGWTNMTKLIVAFRNFLRTSLKNSSHGIGHDRFLIHIFT